MKEITLCADDFAFNSGISEGILKLIELQRLSATTCMTSMPSWPMYAKRLLPYQDKIDLGLHFNLLDGTPLGEAASLIAKSGNFLNLKKLTLRSFMRGIVVKDIESELNRQLDKFIEEMGREPDFLDGHLHIHHFPVIRDAVINVYEKRLRKHNSYIRISSHRYRLGLKNFAITASGALSLKKALQTHHIPYNQSFSGIYNFSQSANYRKYLNKFFKEIQNHGLIMCHPGLPETAEEYVRDPIAKTRLYEFNYLSSDQFLEDCKRLHVKLARFWHP